MYHEYTYSSVCYWWDFAPQYYDFVLEGPRDPYSHREFRFDGSSLPDRVNRRIPWIPPWLVYTEVSPGVFSDAQGDRFVSSCFGSADEREWVPA